MAYNFQTGNNKMNLLMEYESECKTFYLAMLYSHINVWEHPYIGILLSENFLTCIFLGAGWGVMDLFRGLRAHPLLRRLISSCEDMLRILFTKPLWPPSMNWSSEFCCDRNCYTANAWENSEENWIPLGHLTWQERRACWSLFSIPQY
jgi:hypothetical protein